MRVFLTGATGFVGSWTVPALLARDHAVRALVRDADKAAAVLRQRRVDPDCVELVVGDMLDGQAVSDGVAGCDATIHTAAAIAMTSGRRESVFEQNTAGARTVVGAALAAGHDPVVHVSTIAVFVPTGDPVITVDTALTSPRTDYGRSKSQTERDLRARQDRGDPITIVYPGGIIGPDQPTLDATLEGIVGARTLAWPMAPGGVNLVDVRDVAAVLAACVAPGRGPRRLMLGGHFCTWPQLGTLLDEVTGVRARRFPMPRPVLFGIAATLDVVRRVVPLAYPLTRDAAEMMTSMVPSDDEATLAELDIALRPLTVTLEDTVRSLAESGRLSARHAGRLAASG